MVMNLKTNSDMTVFLMFLKVESLFINILKIKLVMINPVFMVESVFVNILTFKLVTINSVRRFWNDLYSDLIYNLIFMRCSIQ